MAKVSDNWQPEGVTQSLLWKVHILSSLITVNPIIQIDTCNRRSLTISLGFRCFSRFCIKEDSVKRI